MYIYVNGKIKHSLTVIYFAETTLEGYVHLLSTVKTAKNTTKSYLNCNIQTSEDEKVKIVCYSPKKRTNLLQAKYKEWNACPRQAFHVMLNHSTKFQRMPKLHLQKQASRLTKNSHLSCTKLKNVSALISMKLLKEKSKWWRNLKTRPLLCMTKKKQSVNLLLLPSSAKIKMQMSNGVLLCICPRCVIKLNLEGIP